MNRKAIALLSGGLDSTLAVKLILEQGIEVVCLNFVTPFCNCNRKGGSTSGRGSTSGNGCQSEAKRVCSEFGLNLKVISLVDEYFEIVRHPKHGYGANMNPCIDCRILMLKKAKEYMNEIGAEFIITGEVLGQRPMSQRMQAMRLIERKAGVEGLILRPLSAKLFSSTIPEIEGIVNRERLLAFSGRSRKPQIAKALEYNLKDYPCPAGGCLLTDPEFAKRMRDLLTHKPDFTLNDVQLLKVGRHFRLTPEAKLIVGRQQDENQRLSNLAREHDLSLWPTQTKGPVGIGRGMFNRDSTIMACGIMARYSDRVADESLEIACKYPSNNQIEYIVAFPLIEEELDRLRI